MSAFDLDKLKPNSKSLDHITVILLGQIISSIFPNKTKLRINITMKRVVVKVL